MTTGIYLLRFNGTNKVYVGQSLNIEQRFAKHLYKLRNNTHNYKLLEAYQEYGLPYLEVLLESEVSDLNTLENEAIEIFNAVNNGFNINSTASGGGDGLFGDTHGNSKYSNQQVLEAFMMLVEGDLYIKEISNLTGISIDTLRDISKCKTHTWIKKVHPIEYAVLEKLVGSRPKGISAEQRGIVYPEIISPEGAVYTITNASEFARDNGLNKSHLVGVLNGKRKTHKGWKLK